MSKTLKVPMSGEFTLYSRWSCENDEGKWKIKKGNPTMDSRTVEFRYSLPSGVNITRVMIYADTGYSIGAGTSVSTVNGIGFGFTSVPTRGANINLPSTSGTYKATFNFRSSGKIVQDTNQHSAFMKYKNVYLLITYDNGGSSSNEDSSSTPKKKKGFPVPPQSVCIYDQSDGAVYMFDGVTKVQHTLALDIQEEPDSKKKDEFVNNARNQPDKLSLDIVMSDVYTGGGDIITKQSIAKDKFKEAINSIPGSLIQQEMKNPWTRSASAFYTLHWLKEQRRKLTVITPQYVHVNMILGNITVNHEDSCPFGWEGQIVFQKAYETVKKKNTTKKKGDSGNGIPTNNPIFLNLFNLFN